MKYFLILYLRLSINLIINYCHIVFSVPAIEMINFDSHGLEHRLCMCHVHRKLTCCFVLHVDDEI